MMSCSGSSSPSSSCSRASCSSATSSTMFCAFCPSGGAASSAPRPSCSILFMVGGAVVVAGARPPLPLCCNSWSIFPCESTPLRRKLTARCTPVTACIHCGAEIAIMKWLSSASRFTPPPASRLTPRPAGDSATADPGALIARTMRATEQTSLASASS